MDPSSSVELVVTPKSRDLGGFTVRRALPDMRRKMVGPFIFFDHMGPAEFAPGHGIDVRQHPHIGIATITYLFDGEILHRDSLGCEQVITPGAVNWMTAGRGIVHSERTPPTLRETGSTVHGIQSWVALPKDSEESEPAFDHYPAAAIPAVSQDGAEMRIVIGSAFGATSPVRTASDMLYVEMDLTSTSKLELPTDCEERAVYVVQGRVDIGAERYDEGSLAILPAGVPVQVGADGAAKAMLLGGAPMDGDRTIWWNFVSSSKERIEQAKADWRGNRFDRVAGEAEFIPLPES